VCVKTRALGLGRVIPVHIDMGNSVCAYSAYDQTAAERTRVIEEQLTIDKRKARNEIKLLLLGNQ